MLNFCAGYYCKGDGKNILSDLWQSTISSFTKSDLTRLISMRFGIKKIPPLSTDWNIMIIALSRRRVGFEFRFSQTRTAEPITFRHIIIVFCLLCKFFLILSPRSFHNAPLIPLMHALRKHFFGFFRDRFHRLRNLEIN